MSAEKQSTSGPLADLSAAGVSIWLDDLSRERIETGNLAELVAEKHVVGVTTNPTIFASALAKGEKYDDQVAGLTRGGASTDDTIMEITTDDVRNACDVLAETYEASGGKDGRVSIEVSPNLAFDTEGTIESARQLWRKVDRPNLFIKIPATTEGLPAITETLGQGISVNVTLIFGLDRYDQVMDAFLEGVEQARTTGADLSKLESVASFFVSRVDSEIDARLEKIGSDEAMGMRGKAAVANAILAFERYEQKFAGDRWTELSEAGANPQRPLWASTGVKNPDYSDTLYVSDLITAGTVNTMPEKTLDAFADHGEVPGDTVRGTVRRGEGRDGRPGPAGHRLRRRHRHLGAGGRRQVRRLLERAGRDRRGSDGQVALVTDAHERRSGRRHHHRRLADPDRPRRGLLPRPPGLVRRRPGSHRLPELRGGRPARRPVQGTGHREVLDALLALADQVGVAARRDAMFRGDHINVTEDRAVLHTALRLPADATLEVDGQDVVHDVHEVLQRVYDVRRAGPVGCVDRRDRRADPHRRRTSASAAPTSAR